MSDLTIDVSQLKKLATDLRRASPQLAKDFLTQLGRAGDVVALAAKEKADFSTRIPATIKVRRRGTRVRVQAGGETAPHAAAFEHDGYGGSFRHPVFGNYDVWVSQPAHPFLRPALEETLPEVELFVVQAVDDAFISAGWRA